MVLRLNTLASGEDNLLSMSPSACLWRHQKRNRDEPVGMCNELPWLFSQ